MASISSVNNTTGSSLTSSIRGFGGLASGLDRDTLIEQFTAGTRSKIAQQKQKQQKLQWTQEAIRGISDKIYDFSSKFTSFSSSSNLTSSKLFSRSQISVNGVNSKYVSATGSAASAENLSINRVQQLARNATMNTGEVSSKTLTTANLGLTDGKQLLDATKAVSTIAGDMLYVKYGNSTYGVTMTDGGQDVASAVSMINEQLKTVEISGGKKLSDVMKATVSSDGKIGFEAIDNANGNRLELAGGTGDILKDLGFLKEGEKFDDLTDEQKNIAKEGGLTAANAATVTKEETLYNLLSEKKLTFSYNGTKGEIQLNKYDASTTLEKVKEDLQTKLDEAFGKGRIKVGDENGSLSFKTMIPGGTEDKSSTLSILSGAGLVGEGGVFGIAAGASNRINLSASVDKAGFKTADFSGSLKDDDSYYLSINGVEIEGITKDSTVNEIMEKINNSKAGVKVSYQSISDQFVLTSTENGAAGEIKFDTDAGGKKNLAELMFNPENQATYTKGQDAILSVSYPGSNQKIEIRRSSNSFDLDGINVTLKGTFGYDKNGAEISDTEAVTFTGSVDSENTTKTVKEMIEAFNDILKLVNTEVSTKPNRKYAPLTDEQKEELSDKTIEKWEEKAKAGLLFADNDLRMMANSMRTVINAADRSKLSEMGITVSDSYSDNGKLVFDEAKFKAALEKDPEAVREVLNRPATDSGDTSQAGLLTRISSIMDRYGKTTGATKGVLVERAGSVHAPTSILKNSLQKQLDSIDTYIDKLNDKLKTEQDRYISQFTSLETLINQMNSQSSYLSSMFSY